MPPSGPALLSLQEAEVTLTVRLARHDWLHECACEFASSFFLPRAHSDNCSFCLRAPVAPAAAGAATAAATAAAAASTSTLSFFFAKLACFPEMQAGESESGG